MVLVNGQPADAVQASDRGLLLGDGLFETLRVRAGRPQLWPYHMERLRQGVERLGFPGFDASELREEVARVSQLPLAMVRVTLTRGTGPRGYAPPAQAHVTRVISGSPMPEAAFAAEGDRLRMGWAELRIGVNPVLAGLKHTSRLEHIVVRQSWEPGWDEAIVRDALGRVVSATQGNLWLREGHTLVTPPVDQAGIAGTRRAWIMDHAPAFGFEVIETYPSRERVERADSLYVSNARLGIRPAALFGAGRPSNEWAQDPVYTMGMALDEAD
ncbi:MAG: aminodeoxychorismate lyase [Thioalkalivibrio sp.]|jgi:4-amino-4-deoxychorismate lyase|nr:aminodeoxychorismate lyase [Thioalkalivibrio sp.]